MNKQVFSFNYLDKILLIFISSFLINSLLLWVVSNFLRSNDLFIWFLTIPISLYSTHLALRKTYFDPVFFNYKALLPYILLFFLLFLSVLYLLEPVIKNPYATIGIPNKDLHDGIASFISVHGHPPLESITQENSFIPNSKNGLYLGYPNVLHVLSAFLNKLGVFEFHSSWIVILISLVITSFSIFLLSKTISNNPYYSAIISGLFAFSSFRIALGVVASIPMLFSYTLVLPTLLVSLFTIDNKNSWFVYFLPSSAIALLAASYSGTIVLFIAFIILYSLLLFLIKDNHKLINLLYLLLFSTPFLLIILLSQHRIYWQNSFPTSIDYDPYELSQRLPPFDKPLYMLFYGVSIIVAGYYLIKRIFNDYKNLLKFYLFLLNLFFLSFIIYDWFFHLLNHAFSSEQLVNVNPDGFFGGLNHQKISRLALLQPFFFIFFLGEITLLIKKSFFQILSLIVIIAFCFFIRLEIPLYQWISPEVKSSFYNQGYENTPYTLLSHLRLFINDQIWEKEIFDALEYLQFQKSINEKILVWDDRDWTEETIAGWGSNYLKHKLLRRKDFNINNKQINSDLVRFLANQKLSFVFILYPTQENLQNLRNTASVSQIWNKGNIFIFKIRN